MFTVIICLLLVIAGIVGKILFAGKAKEKVTRIEAYKKEMEEAVKSRGYP